MKNIVLLFLTFLVLLGCDKKNKIEVIPNYEIKYLYESKVTQQAKPKIDDFEKAITEEFQKIIQELYTESDKKTMLYPVGYNLYIGKSGKIEKVEKIEAIEIEPKGTYIFNNENLLYDKMTESILPIMEKWEFEPAKKFDKNVGMQKKIKALFAIEEKKVIVKKPFNLNFENFESVFFVAVDQMPEPIGGIGAIQKNIKYPEIAKRAGIEGRVFVKAFIDSLGIVAKAEIIRGIGAGCDEASIAAVKKVKFKPGMHNGKPVNTQITVPILFKLADLSKEKPEPKSESKIIKQGSTQIDQKGLAKLEGKIVSTTDDSPLVGANIIIDGTKLGGATHHLGEFFITKIPPGNYCLTVSHPNFGYVKVGKVVLEADKSLKVEIQVNKST